MITMFVIYICKKEICHSRDILLYDLKEPSVFNYKIVNQNHTHNTINQIKTKTSIMINFN